MDGGRRWADGKVALGGLRAWSVHYVLVAPINVPPFRRGGRGGWRVGRVESLPRSNRRLGSVVIAVLTLKTALATLLNGGTMFSVIRMTKKLAQGQHFIARGRRGAADSDRFP